MELQFCHWLPEPQAISYHFQKHSSLEQITADVVNAPLDLENQAKPRVQQSSWQKPD